LIHPYFTQFVPNPVFCHFARNWDFVLWKKISI